MNAHSPYGTERTIISEDKITVEVYIGYLDGTWDTDYIEIPSYSERSVDALISEYMMAHMEEYGSVVFWGVYNISDD